ncbi:phage tail tape measure protein [Lactobacillus amylovorus]|uniref:phage tail tape measure protein n=1 Tax=Lactobacillus amylovorus TaxID=1604 RepID=UPI0023312DFD|nr:phage tail tape measure protein [Lactobacillus amylovorus]MDB6263645.1 phage tail tape measure protein [Lactobacillus amylovorus]
MAEHEGWYVQAKVDISGLLQANKATTALVANLKKVDSGLSGIKPNESLAKSVKAADIATASYIERLKSAGRNYDADKQQAKLYEEQIDRLTNRQKGLTRELENIAEKSGKTSDAYQIQKARINQTATAINNFKKDLQDTQRDMDRVKPTVFNKLTSGANRAVRAGDKMKETLHDGWDRIKGGAIAAGAGVTAFTGAAVKGAKEAGTLQQRYREINNLAVLGGEKQREVTRSIARMQEQGRNISIRYGKSQQEIAAGYEDLVKRGYTTKQALGALKTEVQASVASGDKFSDVTTVSSQVLDAFGMRANSTAKMLKNTKRVVNELAYSADATSTGFSDIGVAMSYVGSTAKANHVSLAQTASALGVLSNNGLEADKAGTALRGTINGLTNQINNIGKKNSIFDKLGIKKSEMVDAHGNLKSLSHDMAVLYQHIQAHSSGGSQQNGFFKSIFGTTGMNGAMILAKDSKEVQNLTDRTAKAGRTGSYVAQLAAKNMGTAQGATASAKQAMNAFSITIGKAVLPALNEASNALAKFLLSKDGKQFQKDVGGAIGHVANQLVDFIKWGSTHKNELKAIGGAILAGYSVTKGLEFVAFLGKVKGAIDELKGSAAVLNGISVATENLNNTETPTASGGLIKSLKGKAYGAGKVISEETVGDSLAQRAVNYTASKIAPRSTAAIPFSEKWGLRNVGVAFPRGEGKVSLARRLTGASGAFQSMRSAGGFRALSGAARITTAATGAGIVASSGIDIYKAIAAKNPKSKFKHYGRALGSAIGGSIGLWFGGAPGAAVGALIGKVVGGWAGKAARRFSKSKFGKAVSHTFKQTAWSVKQDLRPLGRTVNSTVRSVNKSFKGMSREIGKDMRDLNRNREFRNFKNFIKSGMVATLRFSIKEVGTILKGGIKIAGGILKIFSADIKMIARVTGGVVKVVSDVFHGRWRKAWKDAKGIVHAAASGISGILKGLRQVYDATLGAVIGTIKNVWNFFSGKDWKVSVPKSSPNVRNATAAVARMRNGSARTYHVPKSTASTRNVAANNYAISHLKTHSSGGRINTTHGALVGEAGPELAYKNGSTARLLGAHGPQFTKVRAGEHILNARDTAKVMSGGLGNGTVLKGYASGTTGLAKTSKNVAKDYKSMANSSSKTLNKLVKTNKSSWSKISKNAGSSTTSMVHKNYSNWSKISSQTQKLTNQTRKHALSSYSEMRSGVSKQMDNMHESVVKSANSTAKGFGKAMDKSVGYAKSAMSGTIGEMNKGIRGIDKVLSQFGGNGEVIKPAHFATGTDRDGRLTRNTLAVVNDATNGPRQEALVSPDNRLYLPRGENVKLMLPRGWGVLNGTQTQQVAKKAGVQHFAKGSGVSHSQLRKIADRASAKPDEWFKNTYTSQIKTKDPAFQTGTTNLGKNSSNHYGGTWSAALWNVIEDKIGGASGKGGTREAFLHYAEETFHGVPYRMGAMSKRLSDCSGMVAQALEHFGINIGRTTVAMQNSSGVQYLGKSLSKTLPGDLVIFGHGTGAAGHVGIIKNPRTGSMFNETPPYARVTDIASDKSMGYGYYRVRGLHNAKPTKQTAKPSKSLTALVKRELGTSALRWIGNNLAESDGGGLMAGKATGDHDHWMKQAHIPERDWSAINYIVSAESGWNPHAVNPSSGTYGLGQMQGYNLHYYTKHGAKSNPIAQLMGIMDYIHERYGSVAHAVAFRKAHNWYAKGGRHITAPFIAGERGPELISPDGPVRVDTHEQTKRKVRDLADSFKPRRVTTITRAGRQPITININFNGNIGGSDSDMRRMANVARREVARAFEDLLDHGEGSDESIY